MSSLRNPLIALVAALMSTQCFFSKLEQSSEYGRDRGSGDNPKDLLDGNGGDASGSGSTNDSKGGNSKGQNDTSGGEGGAMQDDGGTSPDDESTGGRPLHQRWRSLNGRSATRVRTEGKALLSRRSARALR